MKAEHDKTVMQLQAKIRELVTKKQSITFHYKKGHSNTTRSKSYRNKSLSLCDSLDKIISIDTHNRCILVEPRVTMDQLVKATLKHGLIPPVIPEFKGITVGGAIMGGAAESSSHQWGIFHDTCTKLYFLDGQGNLIQASPSENADMFYALSGSYGTLGHLVAAELSLIPASYSVHLKYHYFSNPKEALFKLQELTSKCMFLDGILFSKSHCVVIEGSMKDSIATKTRFSKWFACTIKEHKAEEHLSLYDYLFRYDRGAFWMGSFLFSAPFIKRYILQGILKKESAKNYFSEEEIKIFQKLPFPRKLISFVTASCMNSQRLWSLLHKSEKWVQDRLIIQDFCIPFHNAADFLDKILIDPGTFPIWLCPIKGTKTPQFLAPHFNHAYFMNFGIYGCPSYAAPMEKIIINLERETAALGGRKVLYSRSYYSLEKFWAIYQAEMYQTLRSKTHAAGVWPELPEKVLSE